MITDMSRNGLAMARPYPFFAGAFATAAGAGVLAGRACTAAGGVISAEIWNTKDCTAEFLSSCFASLISTFWKYPDLFRAVMKFAIALQLFDRRDPLLQDHLLLFEHFNLLLGLFQIRLLRGQLLDFRVFFAELVLPGVIEKSKNQGAEHQSRANEHHRHRCSRVHRTPRGFRSNLSKKVYADHG